MTKVCSSCGIEKKLSLFYKEKKSKDGLRSCCKDCDKKRDLSQKRTKKGIIQRIYYSQVGNSKKRGHKPPSYTKEWLVKWVLDNPEFHRIYDIWAISGYKKNLTPSIDRIDDYVGYTEYNIQITTWGNNEKRALNDKKNGINNKTNKSVVQLTKDRVFVKYYYSVAQASRETGFDHSSICKVCRKEKTNKTVGGFIWEFADKKDLK